MLLSKVPFSAMTACHLIENSIFYNYGLFGLVLVIITIMITFYFYYFIKLIAEIWGCGNFITTQNPTVLHRNTSGQTITQAVNQLPVQSYYQNHLFKGEIVSECIG